MKSRNYSRDSTFNADPFQVINVCLCLASAGAVDEADFENAFFDCPDLKVCEQKF